MRSDREGGVFTVTENTESYSPGIDFTHMTSQEDTSGRTRTVYTQLIDCVILARAQQTAVFGRQNFSKFSNRTESSYKYKK